MSLNDRDAEEDDRARRASPLSYESPPPRPPSRRAENLISAAGACGILSLLFGLFGLSAHFLPGITKPWAPFGGVTLALLGAALTVAASRPPWGPNPPRVDRLTMGLNAVALCVNGITIGVGVWMG